MLFATLIQLCALSTLVVAHGSHEHLLSREEFDARLVFTDKRHVKARTCASEIAEFTARRKAKRAALRKRQEDPAPSASLTFSAPLPSATGIPDNFTCVAAPDVVEGPYYINNEYVRYNLTEDQTGVELILDIGAIDVTTCQPFPDLFIEIWAANATGVYGGYSAGGGGPPPSSNDTSSQITSFIEASTLISSAAPNTTMRPPPGGPGGGSSPLVRNETFLRGGLPTNEEGIVELVTIYPGYYTGRTAHIHAMFHSNWSASENGTLISHAGTNIHVGQLFFEEQWNDEVFATDIYSANTQTRTLNSEDSILTDQSADGNNAFVDIEMLGETVEDGLYGYITIAVDPTNSLQIQNTNYFNSTDSKSESD
jgi:protocatechuate 3,4-dioxygenase beta subunit